MHLTFHRERAKFLENVRNSLHERELAPRARLELATLRLAAEAVKISKCHIRRRSRDLKTIYRHLVRPELGLLPTDARTFPLAVS